ncbi:unnamed protein product [Ixodes pacificus]
MLPEDSAHREKPVALGRKSAVSDKHGPREIALGMGLFLVFFLLLLGFGSEVKREV